MYDYFMARIGKDVVGGDDRLEAMQRLKMTASDIESCEELNSVEKELLTSYIRLVYYSVRNMPCKIKEALYG